MEKKQTILVTDDVELNRVLLCNLFRDEYILIEAENGKEAMAILKKQKVDLVLLDVIMPEMNGFEVLSAMKSNPDLADIPVIVATSEKDKTEQQALNMGADDFILKPYDALVVKKRVENILIKHVLEKEKLQNELRATENELQSLTDSVPGGILIGRILDGNIILEYCNDGYCEICGYEREELKKQYGSNLLLLLYEEDRQDILYQMKENMGHNKRLDLIHRIRYRSGEARWVNMSVIRYRDSSGNLMFHAVVIDITTAKKNELLIEQKNKELQYAIGHDALTGLCNRTNFYIKTKEFLKEHDPEDYAVMQFDIERFKVINELYGTAAGDRILKTIAQSLRDQLTDVGTFGRLEADHFVACLKKDMDYIEEVRAHIERSVSQIGMNHNVTIYYGIYPIQEKMSVDLMCDRANLALRTVKGNYNRYYAVYDDSLHRSVLEEQEVTNEMNQALREGQFKMYLQPVVHLHNGDIISAEALVRWQHPKKGLLTPGAFIPFFERNGFIVKLDAYIREVACQYLSQRLKANKHTVPISVNISRLEFYDTNLCTSIMELVEKYELPPGMLRLEITESSYTDNPNQLLSAMKDLQSFGFQVLMDDFGSGYSSLNMLKDVPVDVLKLDMKFLSGEKSTQRGSNIMASVIRMAQTLNMPVIAEGIETKNQVDLLTSLDCTRGQGFYFARPIPVEEFDKLLDEKAKSNL